MTVYNIGDSVFAMVDGSWVECEIYDLPGPDDTKYKLYCQGEIIKRDLSEILPT